MVFGLYEGYIGFGVGIFFILCLVSLYVDFFCCKYFGKKMFVCKFNIELVLLIDW